VNEHPGGHLGGPCEADEFLRKFEAAEVGQRDFRHRDHLRMAWLYTNKYGHREAEERATRWVEPDLTPIPA
jgi:hypothetical protein